MVLCMSNELENLAFLTVKLYVFVERWGSEV